MRSAVVNSCVYGVSALKMPRKESLAALVNTRQTAAQTSAVLSIKVQHTVQYKLLSDSLHPLQKTYQCVLFVCSALLFPVCSAKPIERERCFGESNHLIELLSWDSQDEGPRKHCPCAGDLHCQHLG